MKKAMRFAYIVLASAAFVACQAIRPEAGLSSRSAQLILTNPYNWPPFAACCFYEHGIALEPQQPFAEREQLQWTDWHLRFGKVYLVMGNDDVSGISAVKSVQCIRGRDTMTVFMRPDNWKNVVYDSIPFQAGRYYLSFDVPRAVPARSADPVIPRINSFAAYFQQHEARLAYQNPFAGCRFKYTTPPRDWKEASYVPPAPTEIFRLLLQHRVYLDRTAYTILPLAKGQTPTD